MNITIVSVVVLAVCIVVAELLLEALRHAVELPWSDSVESAIAAGVGALGWAIIVPRLRR